MTYKEIRKNEEVRAYLKKGNENLGVLGYTDHSEVHCVLVAEHAAYILKKLDYTEHDIELAKIAGILEMPLTGSSMQNMELCWQVRF